MENSEKVMLIQISKGNKLAFEHLFFQYQPNIVAFLTKMTHDQEISQDLSQDLFFQVWTNRERLVDVENISAYLYQMARNKALNFFDHEIVTEQYVNEYLKETIEGQTDNEEMLFAKELQKIINETVEQMSPQRQLVYRLSRESGLSNNDIAQKLNISKRTVERHISSALAVLRKVVFLWVIFTLGK